MLQQKNPRKLDFNKFLDDRSVEIAKFLNELEMDTKKKGHQSLPRSVRRRAMSHNRFRIPRKLRQNTEQQLAKAQAMQRLPKCRKHIRKRRHLITAFKLRSSKYQWLSTHLWAARRMRMIPYYGYKIAFTSNNKSFRSSYRHFRHNCCLVDISYYNCLSLKFKDQLDLPSNFALQTQNSILTYDKMYEVYVYADSSKDTLICPAYLIRLNDRQNSLNVKVFFHPIALDEIKRIKLQGNFIANLQSNQIDMYLIIGPQSTNTLSKSLTQYGVLKENKSLQNMLQFQLNKIIYLAKDQQCQIVNKPMVDFPIPEEKRIKQTYSSNDNFRLRKNILEMYKHAKSQMKITSESQQTAHSEFWKYYEEGQNKNLEETVFKITLRSRYTHKRSNKVTKEQKKKIVQAERQSSSQRKNKSHKKMRDQNDMSCQSNNTPKQIIVETPFHQNATIESVNPVAVCQFGSQKLEGYLVLCSNVNSCRLWRILSHLNVKIIGRRQYAHMHLQSNSLLFPQNFVGTNSYKTHLTSAISKNFTRYLNTPLQKRPNFIALNSVYPFGNPNIKKPLIISLEMISRGKCFQNSYICELQATDLHLITQCLTSGKIGIVTSQVQNEVARKQYKQFAELESQLLNLETKRKIIGSITSGGYLFSKSREGGIGCIDLTLVGNHYFETFGEYVLVRKVTSRHYFLAQITKRF